MVDNSITSQEVAILIDVTSKNIQQLEKVSNSLHQIVEAQKEIQKCLCDNREICPARIIQHCEKHWLSEKVSNDAINSKLSNMQTELLWVKILTGGLCGVLAIAKVVSEFVG